MTRSVTKLLAAALVVTGALASIGRFDDGAIDGTGVTRADPDGAAAAQAAAGGLRARADWPGESQGRTPSDHSTTQAKARGWSVSSPRESPRSNTIAFEPPRDFWTGAEPVSVAFDRAAGDQLGQQLVYEPLSDSVVAAEVNGDGHVDVVQTNVLAGSLSVFLGDGRGGFETPKVLRTGGAPNFVLATRLDRDAHLDLVVADIANNAVSVFRGDGKGGFDLASSTPVPTPRTVAVGHLDRDDLPDLAVAFGGPACPRILTRCSDSVSPVGGVVLLSGRETPGGRTFEPSQVLRFTHEGEPTSANVVAVGDFDGSGRDDLAVGVGASAAAGDRQEGSDLRTGDDLVIHLNRNATDAQPFSEAPHQVVRVGATPVDIIGGDWNRDGRPDLAVLDTQSGDVTSLLGRAGGRFTVAQTNVSVGAVPRTLRAADFDRDGVSDLVTASFGASTVSVLRGIGDGTFEPAVDWWVGDAPTAADVADLDRDGNTDVVAARLRGDQLTVLRNDPHGGHDRVRITRDVDYWGEPGDPLAVHHNLDVYVPPRSVRSGAGAGRPYPVLFFVHGGNGTTGDKSMVSHAMRTLAKAGTLTVSVNYRKGPQLVDAQVVDVSRALQWTIDHAAELGGDPGNVVVGGTSQGALLLSSLLTSPDRASQRDLVRGLVYAGAHPSILGDQVSRPTPMPPALVLNGDMGLELGLVGPSVAFVELMTARGGMAEHLLVADRDHFSLVSGLARDGDPAREAVLLFQSRRSMERWSGTS